MSYVKIKSAEFLAVTEDKMYEIHADNIDEARDIAMKNMGESAVVCRIPAMIGYIS